MLVLYKYCIIYRTLQLLSTNIKCLLQFAVPTTLSMSRFRVNGMHKKPEDSSCLKHGDSWIFHPPRISQWICHEMGSFYEYSVWCGMVKDLGWIWHANILLLPLWMARESTWSDTISYRQESWAVVDWKCPTFFIFSSSSYFFTNLFEMKINTGMGQEFLQGTNTLEVALSH